MIFETVFHEMLDTVAGEFSNTQQNFLRFVLRSPYEDKTRILFETLTQCLINESHIDPKEISNLKDEIRAQFLLTPLYTTKSREEVLSIKARQERFRKRWLGLALEKGIT